MELALSIALIVGIILFVIGLFIVVLGGFKHHFFTGIIALIPVLNIIILPSVWHRSHIGFYLGMVGFILALGAWYGGGNAHLLSVGEGGKFGLNLPTSSSVEAENIAEADQNNDTKAPAKEVVPDEPKQSNVSDYEGDIKELPKQILYQLVFETIDDNETSGLSDEHVRLQQKDGEVIEGKVLKSNSDRLIIEYIENDVTATLEVKADNIRKLERLVKQNHH
jgi:hypothetical protein